MARQVAEAKMDTRAARRRLEAGKEHWRCLAPGKLHLGYSRRAEGAAGTWTMRLLLNNGKKGNSGYLKKQLGFADDAGEADGRKILTFAQAQIAAEGAVKTAEAAAKAAADESNRPMTVADAMMKYVEHLRGERPKALREVEGRARTHILPAFGDKRVSELTTDALKQWRDKMLKEPARLRTRPGDPQRYRAAPATDDEMRARKATVNRTVTVLKAALNYAFFDGKVDDDLAWRRLKPIGEVHAARPGHLSVDEAMRLLNAADAASGFRDLVHGGLLTGCRYGELCALKVSDFARNRISVRHSKSGKPREVRLSEEGVEFFRQLTVGRPPAELMFRKADGKQWGHSHQSRPMLAACKGAGIEPLGFHQLRHTWASLAVMNEMPLLVVAGNLGHADTRMVEKHYGHLTEDYRDEAVRAGAPRFGLMQPTNITPLRSAS